jgi:hypothetical protein
MIKCKFFIQSINHSISLWFFLNNHRGSIFVYDLDIILLSCVVELLYCCIVVSKLRKWVMKDKKFWDVATTLMKTQSTIGNFLLLFLCHWQEN